MTASRGPSELIRAYREGPGLLREAISGMDETTLAARPIPGKWSTREVVCHVVDSDQFMCDRIKRTVATPRPLLIGIESADYAEPLHYSDRDIELDLELLGVQRRQLADDLERLDERAWQRTAVHTENGIQTLLQILDHAVDHLESHIVTIEEKRRALGL